MFDCAEVYQAMHANIARRRAPCAGLNNAVRDASGEMRPKVRLGMAVLICSPSRTQLYRIVEGVG
jgi:hypothetical protein